MDRWIVFDAKGVLYRHGEDVDDLLIPYAQHRGSAIEPERIREMYLEASLGAISSAQLWTGIGIPAVNSDDDYCKRHELTDGVREFLSLKHDVKLACLSNDVSEWSAVLRRRFGIEEAIDAWVISGDIGLRKPDPQIYELLAQRLGADGDQIIFVDDRAPNLDVAAERGWITVQFKGQTSDHRCIQQFAELHSLVSRWS